MLDLAFVWAMLIAFAVFAYVVLDGFDLGMGLIFPLLRTREERDLAMTSVAPVWDGNETWLVLGGGGLLAVFPLAYAVLMTALYPLVIAMLVGLILRGVAFEFRWKSQAHRWLWDIAFAGGSLLAALAQGMMLGAIVKGIAVEGRAYAGGWLDWLTPFSLLTGFSLVIGYALLGVGWLLIKTDGPLRESAFRLAMPLAVGLVAAVALVSAWTPFLDADFMRRWLSWPTIVYVAPVPLLTALSAWWLWASIAARREREPFLATLALFLLSYIGLGISLYPYVVPHTITIWDAAAPDASLGFLLIGAVVLVPLILAYTGYAYWVFRGKVRLGDGYH
ncbi:MAG: cytochrome d ubiquinol oxidase subunit II [Hyphomicrobiaceae bacterium]|nr:cytochrome d ubiquinol oxidase subunit II [Hyphomicrobiaceae bacterium]